MNKKEDIINSAVELFLENGIEKTSVKNITDKAGIAPGTFYLYFGAKEDALRELVRHMGRQLRRALTSATAGAASRIEAERLGLHAFITFAKTHQNLYRVVMESQFVDESIYREYYDSLAAAYQRNLEKAQERGEINPAVDAEATAWAFMGIAHFYGLHFGIWKGSGTETAVETMAHFFERGLGVPS